MRNLSILALFGLSGCSLMGVRWEGVWFVNIPPADPASCEFKGSENFDQADFPDDTGPVNTDWTYTDTVDESDSAVMMEIMKGKSGDLFLVMGGRVFTSTHTSKSFAATWDGTTNDTHKEEHDAGYDFADDINAKSTETFTLTKGAGGVFTGSWALSSSYTEEFKETDQWKPTQVGLSYGQIPSLFYLTGKNPDNSPNKSECSGDCSLSLTTTCDGSRDITAQYAGKYTNGLYDAVKDANQPSGADAIVSTPGTVYTPPGSTTYYGYTF